MTQSAIPLFSQYLRRLRAGHNDPSSDHELLQRFVTHREESAFTALVERHAAMVIGLCRSILRNHHDAEDIFQATFLVMARKAGSIRKGESVGSWLYVVAYRLAHKVRTRAEKRQSCEQRAVFHCEQTPMDAVMWGELRDILHQEISRLPEKYRAALVLCYWQGRTHEQAGQQLGCARGTIKDRLEKARDLLRKRLARRGLALSAAWFATSLSEGMGAVVSEELVQATVRGAMLFSMGRLPAGVVSAPVAACARAHVKQLFMNKLKYGLAFVLMLGVLCGGAGLAALHEAAPPETQPEQPKAIIHKEEQKHIDRQEEPLPAGAVARLGTLRFRHSDSITRIGIGTDGTSILSAAGNGVYVWDLATGKERRRFQHGSPVSSFACSADGRLLASGCQDGTIHVWDAATGQELRSFLAHKDKAPGWIGPTAVFVSGFTPDGRQIVSTGSDETLRLWDAASCEKIREFGKNGAVGSVTLSPDGKTLAGAVKNDQSCDLCLWEVATGRERKRRPQPGKQILASVFSPDGRMLAIAGGEKDSQKPCDIQLWDADAEKLIRTLRGHKGWAHCLFAPDGKTLVTIALSNRDGPARLWDVSTGREIGRIGDSNSVFTQLFFCPDGRTMASYTQSYHTFHFWDRASGKEVNSRGDPITPIDFLSFSPDGRLLATGSTVRWVIRLWDVAAG
jgi:RNA polymerase sigma factor (sigma-70 family)